MAVTKRKNGRWQVVFRDYNQRVVSKYLLRSSSPGRTRTELVSNFTSLSLFWKLGQSPRGTIKKIDTALVPGRDLL